MPIFKGKTENEAIEKGLKELGIDKSHADIKTIQEPTKGILGMFAKEAEVEIIPVSDEELAARKKRSDQMKLLYIICAAFLALSIVIVYLVNPDGDDSGTKGVAETTTFSQQEITTSNTELKETTTQGLSKTTTVFETTQSQDIITANNPEFAAILSSEDSRLARAFSEKYKGRVVEFDGHVAYIAENSNHYDILIYGGDWVGLETTNYTGISMQFYDTNTYDEAFENIDGIRVGDNLHIKAHVGEFTQGDVLRLYPVSVSAR